MGGGTNTDTARKDYERRRINRSVFVNIDELSDRSNSLPHMLPSEEQFSKHIGNVCVSLSLSLCVHELTRCSVIVCSPPLRLGSLMTTM